MFLKKILTHPFAMFTHLLVPAVAFFVANSAQAQHACIEGLGMESQQVWWTGTGNSKFLMDFTSGTPVLSNTGIGQTGSFESTAVYTSPQ